MLSTREINVIDLVKMYKGGVTAVDGVSFEVSAGEIFGFLGPNGAGKSTVIRILTTLGLPTSGEARVGGFDVITQADAVRRIAGVALQEIGLDPLMQPLELLKMQGRLFGMDARTAGKRADELLQLVRLEDAAGRRVGTYSGGMRRRLDLAMALVHEPEILFLDEPTTGLDPASRRDVWNEVRRLNRSLGMTIFLTTQYLEEADALAGVVAIINKGRIAAQGTPTELKATVGNESINLDFPDTGTAEAAIDRLEDLATLVQRDRRALRLYLKGAAQAVPAVMSRLQGVGLDPLSLTLTQPTLDDVFLKVTGERLETEAVPEA